MKHATAIPGIKAAHAVITPTCRANRGVLEAWNEAVRRLRQQYLSMHDAPANAAAEYNLVLTVYRPPEPAPPAVAPGGGE